MAQDPDGSLCALVVDDDALILMDACAILEDAGYRTVEARDADAALRVLREHDGAVTLLFTDVQMPGGIDGFALARQVSRCWPHIAIVVASGQLRPAEGDLPDGATFIGKPFSAEVVHGHLRERVPDTHLPTTLKD